MSLVVSVRERALRVGALLDEWIEHVASTPATAALLRCEPHKTTLEYEWHFDERRVSSNEYVACVDDFCEMAVARDLCAPDWFDDPTRIYVRDGCAQCKGTGRWSAESDECCACPNRRPWRIESVLRMLSLPASMIVAQESITRGRLPSAVGLLYVERFDEGERAVFVPESSKALTPGVWVRRPLPALIGVRWPRVKTA
ncbi:MAG: hypothetical protein JNK05_41200 [Myxococcales bacterium]|nr:hypothetical protein [Myxococcales bacterium]